MDEKEAQTIERKLKQRGMKVAEIVSMTIKCNVLGEQLRISEDKFYVTMLDEGSDPSVVTIECKCGLNHKIQL